MAMKTGDEVLSYCGSYLISPLFSPLLATKTGIFKFCFKCYLLRLVFISLFLGFVRIGDF
jgi:hypothetical protein